MTYAQVDAIFNEVYEELRELNGENAPNSNLWYAGGLSELREQLAAIGWAETIQDTELSVIGDAFKPQVAIVFACGGPSLTTIREDATEEAVIGLFRELLLFDEA